MAVVALTPSASELHLEHLSITPERIVVVAQATRRWVRCPACRTPATRVHSRYVRRIADLPWQGVPVHIELHTRRFFCDASACECRIFTERLPETTAPHARRTRRLAAVHRLIALCLGGEAGERLSRELGLAASADSLLRAAKAPPEQSQETPTPRCLGVDDWAWRKGRRYGTLLCDLERRCVVDLLPERSADSLAAWLRAHPGVEVISRDRAGMYVEGAKQGAPGATQVADRFHLFRNLTDALERILQQGHTRLRSATVQAARGAEPQKAAEPWPTRSERQRDANRARRLARYNEVVALKQRGLSNSAIARQTGVERRTGIRWLKSDGFPERRPTPPRDCRIDSFLEHLRRRWEEGATNAALLFREIRGMGFQGGYSCVRDVVQQWRGTAPPTPRSAGPRPLAAVRQSAWLLALSEEERTSEQRAYIQALQEQWPEVAQLERLARVHSGSSASGIRAAWVPGWTKRSARRYGALHAASSRTWRRFAMRWCCPGATDPRRATSTG
jgi:transposase